MWMALKIKTYIGQKRSVIVPGIFSPKKGVASNGSLLLLFKKENP